MAGDNGENNSYLSYLVTGLVLAVSILAVLMHLDALPNAAGANKIQAINYQAPVLPKAN